MNPLYRFDFDEETGNVNRVQIDSYSQKRWSTGEEFYRYEEIRGNVKHCYLKSDIDRYKSGRLYSFDPDMEHAKEIIKHTLNVKRAKAHDDYLRYTEIVNKLEGFA